MNQRREDRRQLRLPVSITWNDDGGIRHGSAMTENLSPGGACLRTAEAIPVGVTVNVSGHGSPFTGVVRYRLVENDVYVIGLQRWDDLQP